MMIEYHCRFFALFLCHSRANVFALPKDLAVLRFMTFQTNASLLAATSGWPGTGWHRLTPLLNRVFFCESLFSKMCPRGLISFLAFQIVDAIVVKTASVKLLRPALDKMTSDLILDLCCGWKKSTLDYEFIDYRTRAIKWRSWKGAAIE